MHACVCVSVCMHACMCVCVYIYVCMSVGGEGGDAPGNVFFILF